MPKIEVILTSNIVGLGAESDQVKVAAGYARNYLLPQHLAVPLTHANKRRIESLRQKRAEREAHEFNTMSELSKSITKFTCLVKVKTGDDNKMFGSVTSGTIADELKNQFDIVLDKKKIHLESPIRTLGEHLIELRLHSEVKATLKVKVESTTPPAPLTEAEKQAAADAAAPRTEKRGRHFDGRSPAGQRTITDMRPKPDAKPRPAAKPEKAEKAK